MPAVPAPARPADRTSVAPPSPAEEPARPGTRMSGLGVSPGVAIGHAYLLDRGTVHIPQRHIAPAEVEKEVQRLKAAVEKSAEQIQQVEGGSEGTFAGDHATILQAYVLMLRDPQLVDASIEAIRKDKMNAEWALRRATGNLKTAMEGLSDEYFRERRHDVDFVAERVLRNLMGRQTGVPDTLPDDAVVVAHDLSPADMLELAR